MSGNKRHFPYYSSIEEVELKRQNISESLPGYERSQPKTFQAPVFTDEQQVLSIPQSRQVKKPYLPFHDLTMIVFRMQIGQTDFSTWTEGQIKVIPTFDIRYACRSLSFLCH
jgi:hypothetical protein